MAGALPFRFDLARLLRRDRLEQGPVTLDRRRVFILPTRSGLTFAVVLLAMLIGAINYGISLAFALTFLLAGMGMMAMVHTFRNLHGLTFRAGHPRPAFAGEEVTFTLRVENAGGRERSAVALELTGSPPLTIDVEADDARWVELYCPAPRRGRLPLPRITVGTRFPLGLFRAWGYLYLREEALVYPRPAPQRGLPEEAYGPREGSGDRGIGSDDFAALRVYRPGDSLRHVHWKAVARGQGMVTKQFGGDRSDRLWLSWEALPGLGPEERLSRLCRWVLEAEARDATYGLDLPGRRIEPGRGESHRRRCLEALALYGEDANA